MVEAEQEVDDDARRQAARVQRDDVEHVRRHHEGAAAERTGAQRAWLGLGLGLGLGC